MKPAARANPAVVPRSSADDSGFRRPFKDPKVVMYGTEWCAYCRKADAFLQSPGVNPVERDVEKDPESQREWRRKAGSRAGVPVIEVEGRVEIGFNPARLRAAPEEKRIN